MQEAEAAVGSLRKKECTSLCKTECTSLCKTDVLKMHEGAGAIVLGSRLSLCERLSAPSRTDSLGEVLVFCG